MWWAIKAGLIGATRYNLCMKIFALYSKVELTEKPDWFDAFYAKYNQSIAYHVTLKQPCYLEGARVEEVKQRLLKFFVSKPVPEHEITLTFNELALDDSASEAKTIMLNAEHDPRIHKLQQGILSVLDDYRQHVYPESRSWEENFKPHITIASDISSARYEEALKELRRSYICKGLIRDVALIIVERMVPEEADRSENQQVYPL